MPRVVPEYKEQARARIVDAAVKSIAQHGLLGSTMDAIAADLGVSKGALYLYFPSKTKLLEAIFDRSREDVLRRFEEAVASGDVAERIASVLEDVFSGEFDISVWNQLTLESANDPELRAMLRRDQRMDLDHMRRFLHLLEQRGRIPPMEDPDVTTEIVLLLLSGTFVQIVTRGKPQESRRRLVRALNHVLRISPPPHRKR
jgi:AcrR family transcriptional regulator